MDGSVASRVSDGKVEINSASVERGRGIAFGEEPLGVWWRRHRGRWTWGWCADGRAVVPIFRHNRVTRR